MQIDLTGKTALITGSTEGIGYAIARQLARAGADVVINGRSEDKTAKAAERLRGEGAGGTVTAVAADVATAEGCDALVGRVPHVDILINNAGIFQPLDFFEASDAVWDRHWQVNVMSAVRLSRAYLPGMQKLDWGRVIFIASESGFNIPVEMIHYGVSKTADIAVARGLAKRMAGTGVTVNSVLPGPTLSEGVEAMLADERAKTAALITSNDVLSIFPPAELRTTFETYCDKLQRDYQFGKVEVISVIGKLKKKDDQARAVLQIGVIIGGADGTFDENERQAVKEACFAVGISPSEFDL